MAKHRAGHYSYSDKNVIKAQRRAHPKQVPLKVLQRRLNRIARLVGERQRRGG